MEDGREGKSNPHYGDKNDGDPDEFSQPFFREEDVKVKTEQRQLDEAEREFVYDLKQPIVLGRKSALF